MRWKSFLKLCEKGDFRDVGRSEVKIFKVVGADGFNIVSPVGGGSYSSTFDGTSLAGVWQPIELEVVSPQDRCEDSDCPRWFSGVLVFSSRVLELVQIHDDEVELLPVRTKPNQHGFEYDYYIANVIKVVDCLDAGRSKITRYPSSGRVMRIEEYVFDTEQLEGVWIFKLPEQRTTAIFATEDFVDQFRSTDLEGLVFECVYSDSKKRRRWSFLRGAKP